MSLFRTRATSPSNRVRLSRLRHAPQRVVPVRRVTALQIPRPLFQRCGPQLQQTDEIFDLRYKYGRVGPLFVIRVEFRELLHLLAEKKLHQLQLERHRSAEIPLH
jgi:hypothetical protein